MLMLLTNYQQVKLKHYESNADTNAYTDTEKTKLTGIKVQSNVIEKVDGVDLTPKILRYTKLIK